MKADGAQLHVRAHPKPGLLLICSSSGCAGGVCAKGQTSMCGYDLHRWESSGMQSGKSFYADPQNQYWSWPCVSGEGKVI